MENIKIIENNKILKFFLIAIVGSLILTISAKIKIPFYPVPMTMQTFVVLFLGICFGYKIAIATVGLLLRSQFCNQNIYQEIAQQMFASSSAQGKKVF